MCTCDVTYVPFDLPLQTSMNVGEGQTSAVRMPPAMTLLVATHVAVIQASLEMGLTAMVRNQLPVINLLISCILYEQTLMSALLGTTLVLGLQMEFVPTP